MDAVNALGQVGNFSHQALLNRSQEPRAQYWIWENTLAQQREIFETDHPNADSNQIQKMMDKWVYDRFVMPALVMRNQHLQARKSMGHSTSSIDLAASEEASKATTCMSKPAEAVICAPHQINENLYLGKIDSRFNQFCFSPDGLWIVGSNSKEPCNIFLFNSIHLTLKESFGFGSKKEFPFIKKYLDSPKHALYISPNSEYVVAFSEQSVIWELSAPRRPFMNIGSGGFAGLSSDMQWLIEK